MPAEPTLETTQLLRAWANGDPRALAEAVCAFAGEPDCSQRRAGEARRIDSQLAWDEGFGKLLVVKLVNGGGRLSVFVPDKIAGNINVGQRFHMTVVIKDQGLINVESLDKY